MATVGVKGLKRVWQSEASNAARQSLLWWRHGLDMIYWQTALRLN